MESDKHLQREITNSARLLATADPVIQACLKAVEELPQEKPASEMLGDIFKALKKQHPLEYRIAFKRGLR